MFSPRRGLRLAFTDTARSQFRPAFVYGRDFVYNRTNEIQNERRGGEGGGERERSSGGARRARFARARRSGRISAPKIPAGALLECSAIFKRTYTSANACVRARARHPPCATRRNICGLLLVLFARARAGAFRTRMREDPDRRETRVPRDEVRQGAFPAPPRPPAAAAATPRPSANPSPAPGKAADPGEIVNIAHRLADAIGYGASRTQTVARRCDGFLFVLSCRTAAPARGLLCARARTEHELRRQRRRACIAANPNADCERPEKT